MKWNDLTSVEQLNDIVKQSYQRPQLIFKHSTRCSISSVAKNRLEREKEPEHIDFYYLDLIRYKDVSNRVTEAFKVYHESPQVLLIKNGECIYEESHGAIIMEEIIENAK